jgi:NADH:ubiquinone oxidoreductase subunit 2 (subunit N)
MNYKQNIENQIKIYQTKSDMIKDIRYISEFKGQFFSNPLLSLSLSLCLFSMAGIPPLIGFFSKQFVLYSAIQSGYNFIALVAIIVSVISASYYLKIIKVLHTETLETNNVIEESNNNLLLENKNETINNNTTDTLLTNFHSFLISSLTLSILFFILKPSLILNSTQLLSLSLFNF